MSTAVLNMVVVVLGAVLVTVFMVKILPVAVAVFPLPVVVELPKWLPLPGPVCRKTTTYADYCGPFLIFVV